MKFQKTNIAKLDDGYAVSAPCGDFIIRESFGETIVILPNKRLVIIKAE